MAQLQFTIRRLLFAFFVFAVGLTVLIEGVRRETANPRSNAEDLVALCVLAVGVSLVSAAASIPFAKRLTVAAIAFASPFIAYVLLVMLIWGSIICFALWKAVFG
jgi:putative Mn2+ efflux pump MntP